MLRICGFLVIASACMRPQFPHPLDDVLGNRKLSPNEVRSRILNSEEFRVVVKKAVQMARWHGEQGAEPTYAQCVRRSIANQLRNDDAADPPPFRRLSHHAIEQAIRPGAGAKEIIESLSRSKPFMDLIKTAVSESEPLAPGAGGFTFGQGIRVSIGSSLSDVDPLDEEMSPGIDLAPAT